MYVVQIDENMPRMKPVPIYAYHGLWCAIVMSFWRYSILQVVTLSGFHSIMQVHAKQM